MDRESDVHLTLDAVRLLAREKLCLVGLAPDHADAVAETMVAGERDGCASHGLYRLLVAAASVRAGVVVPDAVPQVSHPATALVRVDGGGGFAQLAFAAGVPHLLAKARSGGIAAMALNNVVHFAALWPEVEAIAAAGLVALAFTPSHAWVAPAGGTKPVFGTNPIAFGWLREGTLPFVFDFATSAVARGEIELHRRGGKAIPDDWGYDADGQPSTDAKAVLDGAMRTFGGHKGSALAAMVELLAGPLIGDLTSAESLAADGGRGGSPIGGELIVAIDPAGFLGEATAAHRQRAGALFDAIEAQGARLPSARRYAARRRSIEHGVTIPAALYADIMRIGAEYRMATMRKTTAWCAASLGIALIAGDAHAAPKVVARASAAHPADTRLRAIYTAEYAWRQRLQGPSEDSKNATPGLPDVGPATQVAKQARWTQTLAALDAIPAADLSPAEQVNLAVYRGQIAALLNEQRYRDYEKPLTSDTSFWGDVAESTRGRFVREQDYRDYLTMLGDVPRYFDQNIANMRAGLKRGFTPARVTLTGRDIGVAQVVDAGAGADSPFYAPFKAMPAAIPAATQALLREQAKAAIRSAVVPAHQRLLAFLRQEYLPGARTTIAAYDLPDGRAYYQSKIDAFTTETRSADAIHAIGLAEMTKIRTRMQGVMDKAGFKGDLPAFLTFLRIDPQFYARTPQQLLDRAAWIAKTFDGKASDYFGHLPRSRFAIKPVPADLAPFYTGGRGGPGIYLVNTYNLPARPLYSLPALTLHESAPGHAFQMPLAMENKALPAFRRDTYLSVYGEGWALYCEALGEEMGMYQTPYELFGMLSYQAWRASRLVVDTGIHAKGWTREQAQRYLHDNTALSDHEIETEVDRYVAWPGQALSYYTGELAIQRARARAETALGAKFNIRAFHDAVLALGSVPVSEIDRRVDQLIAAGGKGPYPDEE